MFDTRGDQGQTQRSELLKTLETQKTEYDKQLHSDWIVKVFDRCRVDCLLRPALFKQTKVQSSRELDENMAAQTSEIDDLCGRNCLRKYDKIYKLYTNMEKDILNSFMSDQEIDQEDFEKYSVKKLQKGIEKDMAFAAQQAAQK